MNQLTEKLTSELPVSKGKILPSFFSRLVRWRSFPARALASARRTNNPFEEAFAELARELNGTQAEE